MKISIEHLNTVEPVAVDELGKLHTGSLLARLKKLRELQECFEHSDWLPEERDAVANAGQIAFKDTEIWQNAVLEVKDLLAKRENVAKGSKEKRQMAAREKQTR